MLELLKKSTCLSAAAWLFALPMGCRVRHTVNQPVIVFKQVPPRGAGGAGATDIMRGHVSGAAPGDRIVVYTLGGSTWWVQPLTIRPFTKIEPDGNWSSSTHLGSQYAALLVAPGYQPLNRMEALPAKGQQVLALATAAPGAAPIGLKQLQFSHYEWSVRQTGSDRNGSPHIYEPANVSVDAHGFLHLTTSRGPTGWTCSEVALARSLGYGTYAFSVEDVTMLDPAAVLSMFTWDPGGTDQDRREMDVEITRWGNLRNSNAQYVVQPFYRPTNTYRYLAPPGLLTYVFRWEPGRVAFATFRGRDASVRSHPIAQHTFTADVPTPETESVRMNLCTFDYARVPQQRASDVTIESFQFLP